MAEKVAAAEWRFCWSSDYLNAILIIAAVPTV